MGLLELTITYNCYSMFVCMRNRLGQCIQQFILLLAGKGARKGKELHVDAKVLLLKVFSKYLGPQ